ncbi:MAG: 5-oxoprolinase subunit PxpA [Pseudomonadota bacterium]
MTVSIDLNADLGELPGPSGRASDAAVLASVTSCAIACGGHAGDEASMAATLMAAKRAGVSPGAHPSYPDREGFGRRSLDLAHADLRAALAGQLEAIAAIADRLDIPLSHVKPHGALYNDAAEDPELAEVISGVVFDVFQNGCALIGLPGSELARAAARKGLTFHAEGFMDRAYLPTGRLMPRSEPGAVLSALEDRLAQARQIALDRCVDTEAGSIRLDVQTLCLHGDSPGAAATATAVKAALLAEGVALITP